MPFATSGNARIRTNTPAENAYNALDISNRNISKGQLRLSTGKRINSAGDDVAGYITSRALQARNGSLKAALGVVGDATSLSSILQDSLENINGLITTVKESVSYASSGAMGTDEKVALAKAAYRLVQQIQTVVDSTVYGGAQVIAGDYQANFYIGNNSQFNLLTLNIDMSTTNNDFNVASRNFNLNSMSTTIFAGVTDLDMSKLNDISATDLGIFASSVIGQTISSLSEALNNVNKVASYVGGISNRLQSQEDLLRNQVVNYNAAISRLEDADVAKEQLELVRQQFLQQASLISLTQSNQNPNAFLQLIRG
jgi:flagellin